MSWNQRVEDDNLGEAREAGRKEMAAENARLRSLLAEARSYVYPFDEANAAKTNALAARIDAALASPTTKAGE